MLCRSREPDGAALDGPQRHARHLHGSLSAAARRQPGAVNRARCIIFIRRQRQHRRPRGPTRTVVERGVKANPVGRGQGDRSRFEIGLDHRAGGRLSLVPDVESSRRSCIALAMALSIRRMRTRLPSGGQRNVLWIPI